MPSITVAQICAAITTTLGAAIVAPSVLGGVAQSFNELSEGIQDTPTLQVYPETLMQDAFTQNDRLTFGGGNDPKRATLSQFNADLYAAQRKDIAEDMAILVACIDAMTTKFELQNTKPYFGLVGIQAFKWSGQRVTFSYGNQTVMYTGFRFMVGIWTY